MHASLSNACSVNKHQCAGQVRTLVAQPSEQSRAPAEVTRLAAAPDSPHVAAGHADGSIRIWNLGHRRLRGALGDQCGTPAAARAGAPVVPCSSTGGACRCPVLHVSVAAVMTRVSFLHA